MSKRILSVVIVVAGIAALTLPTLMAHGNKPGSATATIGGGQVKVDFVGPSSMGRDVMSLLQPGSYWRMGADKATTLTTDVELKVGGAVVPKGTYKLVAHLSEDKSWSLVVAEDVGSGSKPTKVVAEAKGSITTLDAAVDNMIIKLEVEGGKGKLVLDWGNARLIAEFSAA